MSAVFDNGLRLDSSLTLAIKAIVQAEETARDLSPDVDVAQPRRSRRRRRRSSSSSSRRSVDPPAAVDGRPARPRSWPAARRRSRRRLLKWLDVVNQGGLTVELDTSDLNKLDREGRAAWAARRPSGSSSSGQLIGTAIAMTILLQPRSPRSPAFAYVAMIAFGVTLLVSFFVLFRLCSAATTDARPGRPARRSDAQRSNRPGPPAWTPAFHRPHRRRLERRGASAWRRSAPARTGAGRSGRRPARNRRGAPSRCASMSCDRPAEPALVRPSRLPTPKVSRYRMMMPGRIIMPRPMPAARVLDHVEDRLEDREARDDHGERPCPRLERPQAERGEQPGDATGDARASPRGPPARTPGRRRARRTSRSRAAGGRRTARRSRPWPRRSRERR